MKKVIREDLDVVRGTLLAVVTVFLTLGALRYYDSLVSLRKIEMLRSESKTVGADFLSMSAGPRFAVATSGLITDSTRRKNLAEAGPSYQWNFEVQGIRASIISTERDRNIDSYTIAQVIGKADVLNCPKAEDGSIEFRIGGGEFVAILTIYNPDDFPDDLEIAVWSA